MSRVVTYPNYRKVNPQYFNLKLQYSDKHYCAIIFNLIFIDGSWALVKLLRKKVKIFMHMHFLSKWSTVSQVCESLLYTQQYTSVWGSKNQRIIVVVCLFLTVLKNNFSQGKISISYLGVSPKPMAIPGKFQTLAWILQKLA